MTAKEIIAKYQESTGKEYSQRELSDILGWSTAATSQVIQGKYPNQVAKETEMAKKLLGIVEDIPDWKPISIKPDIIIATRDFNSVFELCNGLIASDSSLNASIGLVIGDAGRGKTTTVQRYAAENPNASYVLYMGFSRASLFKEIAESLVGRSSNSYYNNLQIIMAATQVYRKLIIIDEADRMPKALLEDLRTLNEKGKVPLLLVGEPSLANMVKKADRIESRIRKPRIEFHQLDYVTLATLYSECCGLQINRKVAEELVKLSNADFRVAANDLQNIVRMMNINRYTELTEEVVNEYKRT